MIGIESLAKKSEGLQSALKEWSAALRPSETLVISPASTALKDADSAFIGYLDIITPRNLPQRVINAMPKSLTFHDQSGMLTFKAVEVAETEAPVLKKKKKA